MRLPNEKNLKSLKQRTTSEQREIAIKGGKASGEARRKRKTLKEELLALLEEPGMQESISVALINEVLYGKNRSKAFEVLRDSIGEKPIDRLQVNEVDTTWFKKDAKRNKRKDIQ